MKIGDILKDKDGREGIITNLTSNSVEVYLEKKTKEGINCKQWFQVNDWMFKDRFGNIKI